jgi:hypothetical protein
LASRAKSGRPSFLRAIATGPLKAIQWLSRKLFSALLIAAIIFIPLTVLFIVVRFFVIDIAIGLFDLIFRTHIRQSILSWFQYLYDAILTPIVVRFWNQISIWSDQVGLTALLLKIFELFSVGATEFFRGVVLFLIFLAAGFAVYHLRIVRRVVYALIELGVAVIAMWIAVEGMVGGNFSLGYFVALISGLYIMVRGLQNIDDGLREMAHNKGRDVAARSAGQAWLELWEAAFYDRYDASSFSSRFQRIRRAYKRIAAATHSPIRERHR